MSNNWSNKNNKNNMIFYLRTNALLFHNNKILIHRKIKDGSFFLPGGRIKMLEDSETALKREFIEELNININIVRLLWIFETFYDKTKYDVIHKVHEICFYYLVDVHSEEVTAKIFNNDVYETEENGVVFEFRWVDVDELRTISFYPEVIKNRITDLPQTTGNIIEKQRYQNPLS